MKGILRINVDVPSLEELASKYRPKWVCKECKELSAYYLVLYGGSEAKRIRNCWSIGKKTMNLN